MDDESPLALPAFAVRLVPWSGARPDQIVVSVTGDVDMHAESRLRDALYQLGPGPPRRVVLDLSGVGFMASAGVHALLDAAALLRSGHGALILACAQPVVARVLSLTGTDQLMPVVGTVDEALALSGLDGHH